MEDSISRAQKYAAIIRERSNHSDKPIDLFCKQHGIKRQSFYYWKNKLQKSTRLSVSSQSNFIPIRGTKPLLCATPTNYPFYEIRFSNGNQVHLPGSMAIDDLTRVLHSVASIPS